MGREKGGEVCRAAGPVADEPGLPSRPAGRQRPTHTPLLTGENYALRRAVDECAVALALDNVQCLLCSRGRGSALPMLILFVDKICKFLVLLCR